MACVFITGGNRGIGSALAQRYAARGDTVITTYRTDGTQAQPDKSEKMIALKADVTDLASLKAVQRELRGRAIDLLICNAGMNAARGGMDAADNTPEAWADLMATNIAGVFFTVQVLAPLVIKAKGKVAVISSRMGSSTAAAGTSYLYRASKAAASNITANLAVELKPKGVAVASYHPGWVRTDMGGAGADIDVATSANGLMKQFDALSLDKTGGFFNYDGTAIPY